jgi:hypothetical protein
MPAIAMKISRAMRVLKVMAGFMGQLFCAGRRRPDERQAGPSMIYVSAHPAAAVVAGRELRR